LETSSFPYRLSRAFSLSMKFDRRLAIACDEGRSAG
jgi:hypothetical protein